MVERLRLALLGACALFVGVGLTLAFAGEAVFGPWRDAVAGAMLGGAFPASLRAYAGLTDAILGGSIVGKWVAIAWLVHEPLRRRERWALGVLLVGHLGWFALDATASVLYGAAVNVWCIDLLPLLLVGGLAAAMWPHTEPTPRRAGPVPRSVRLLTAICVGSVGIGLLSAFAIRAPIFHYYGEATARVYFDGAMGSDALAWQRFAYGLIGATIAGHFLVLTGALLRAPRQRWVLHAVATSMTAWFVVDTAGSLLHDGLFNVVQINLPSYLGTLAALAFAYRADAARDADTVRA